MSPVPDIDTVVGGLPGGTSVVASSQAAGRDLLATVDDFVAHQSRFDHQARVNLQYSTVVVTRDIYLDYVRSQVMVWTAAEVRALQAMVASICAKLRTVDMPLPPVVYLVKTTGLEEGYAAYTRRRDTICLPANMVASLATSANYGDPGATARGAGFRAARRAAAPGRGRAPRRASRAVHRSQPRRRHRDLS